MSTVLKHKAAVLALACSLLDTTLAAPPSTHLLKRNMSAGAQAGLGIGIAVAIVIVALVVTFLILHMRRRARNEALDNERAILAGEKNADGTDKVDKFAPEPQVSSIPRRNKSVKDRLMGPLYRESMYMPPLPNRAKLAGGRSNRQSTMTASGDESSPSKPWQGGESSPRPSFSSKRATRMMMMM